MSRRGIERRRFLRAVGATALTYPFLRALPSFAQQTSAPQYLILVFTPCGAVRYLWGAQGPARGASTVASRLTGASGSGAFRATLQPLATGPTLPDLKANLASINDLTSRVIVLDGLNVGTADGTHEAGMGALWTGILNTGAGAAGKGVSIDQAVAGRLSSCRPFQSVALMARDANDFTDRSVKTRMIYDPTDFVDPYDNPAAARSTLFPALAATDGGVDKKSAIRKVVFNQLNAELTGLQSRLCTEDRLQLQSIQQAWATLDQQLAAAATAAASCAQPGVPPATLDFPTAARLQMDILALALACDLTRVASLQFSTSTSNVTHTWIDPTDSATHHTHSHSGPSSLYSLGADLYNPSGYQPPGIPSYDRQLAPIDLWYANQVAYLAQRLNNLKTASGANLLAQSVMCWGNELDQGQPHNHDDTPFVLIGGAGGKLKGGQLVQFPLNLANGSANAPPTANRFHNDLLITLSHAMGTPLGTFGTTSGINQHSKGTTLTFCTGPIMEILNA